MWRWILASCIICLLLNKDPWTYVSPRMLIVITIDKLPLCRVHPRGFYSPRPQMHITQYHKTNPIFDRGANPIRRQPQKHGQASEGLSLLTITRVLVSHWYSLVYMQHGWRHAAEYVPLILWLPVRVVAFWQADPPPSRVRGAFSYSSESFVLKPCNHRHGVLGSLAVSAVPDHLSGIWVVHVESIGMQHRSSSPQLIPPMTRN